MKKLIYDILNDYTSHYSLSGGEGIDAVDSNHFPDIVGQINDVAQDLLHQFFNSRSDASPLEATEQEHLELEFSNWVKQH